MKVRTEADIAQLEQVPVTERIRHGSVADLLREAATRHAGRLAIRYLSGSGPADPVRDVTFDELLRRVIQAANLLHAHGINPEDTVTLLMPSVPETFFALWGAEIAAVANPVNYFLEASQIAAIMNQAGARALIAADASIFPDIWPKVEAIRAVMPELKVFRVGGAAAPGIVGFEEACAAQPADRLVAPRTILRDTVAALFHTGGTTGLPKLAKHTHGALALMAWTNTLVFGHGSAEPAASISCWRLAVRRAGTDRQWLDDRHSDAARRAQSQRGARLLEHRRAQQDHGRRCGADQPGGDHERAARGP